MKRLNKEKVHAIRHFIGYFFPKSSKQERAALLSETIKNFECAANQMGGHECFIARSPTVEGFYITKIAYFIKLDSTRHCIAVDPLHDFEDIDD